MNIEILFKCEVGNLEVLQSGSIIIPKQETVSFTIENLTFKLKFLKDSSRGTEIEGKVDNDTETEPYYLISIYNFEKGQVSNMTEPVELAKLQGKSLKFIFSMRSLASEIDSILLNYTWFLGK